jgi:hypothetical protein
MQKRFLVLVLMFFAMSSAVWAECGKFCDLKWWQTATTSDIQAELDAGADVNTRGEFGQTPLHWAAGRSTAEIVQRLIAADALLPAPQARRDRSSGVGLPLRYSGPAIRPILCRNAALRELSPALTGLPN